MSKVFTQHNAIIMGRYKHSLVGHRVFIQLCCALQEALDVDFKKDYVLMTTIETFTCRDRKMSTKELSKRLDEIKDAPIFLSADHIKENEPTKIFPISAYTMAKGGNTVIITIPKESLPFLCSPVQNLAAMLGI
jgi:hypothetical protein